MAEFPPVYRYHAILYYQVTVSGRAKTKMTRGHAGLQLVRSVCATCMCNLRCSERFCSVVNPASQCSHTNGRRSAWLVRCVYNVAHQLAVINTLAFIIYTFILFALETQRGTGDADAALLLTLTFALAAPLCKKCIQFKTLTHVHTNLNLWPITFSVIWPHLK